MSIGYYTKETTYFLFRSIFFRAEYITQAILISFRRECERPNNLTLWTNCRMRQRSISRALMGLSFSVALGQGFAIIRGIQHRHRGFAWTPLFLLEARVFHPLHNEWELAGEVGQGLVDTAAGCRRAEVDLLDDRVGIGVVDGDGCCVV